MDTEKEYIKMCEKAEEIQKKVWRAKDGDYCVGNDYEKWDAPLVHALSDDEELLGFKKNIQRIKKYVTDNGLIWLPRQDQLQNMVYSSLSSWQLVQTFWNWLWTKESASTKLSMEQLWLAFVMREKHGKIWTGEEWKKGEK